MLLSETELDFIHLARVAIIGWELNCGDASDSKRVIGPYAPELHGNCGRAYSFLPSAEALFGRFPTDDTMRNLFRAFGMGQVQRLFEPLAEWQMQRLPQRVEATPWTGIQPFSKRYGQQEGFAQRPQPAQTRTAQDTG